MKILLLLTLCLCSCQTNAVTGKRELTPEALAAMNRAGTRVLIAGEKYVDAKIDTVLRVDDAK